MGTLWARQGCLVLVPDQLGHGERRQHPFRTSDDYPAEFRAGRQDYYFRYNVAQQLHLVGESLIGWMAWDLLRGVDLLLQRPGIDPARIILLGAVAGGGDPAAVTAAIDPRIAAAVPFNFGGPQPETQYPLPDDAEHSFRYAGGGSWESTRNLRLSARDGFPPWVIVGSLAPRRLIYAHEFVWDRDRDPVWKRLETIHAWYDASDSLAFAHGFGRLQGNPPDASHCTNIGPPHREMMTPSLQRWFGIQATEQARINPRPADQLLCLSGKATDGLTLTPVHRLADRLAGESLRRARNDAAGTTPTPIRPETLRTRWRTLLGDVDPYPVAAESRGTEPVESIQVERLLLTGERNVRLPVLLLTPARPRQSGQRPPLVVGLSQHGKSGFLEHRSDLLAQLLDAGIAVCLPDLRGCGESRPGDGRGRQSEATSVSSSELMLGQTLLGSRLKDLRSLLNYLRARPDVDPRRIALCGESFAPVNPPDANLERPLDVDQPALAEPLGPTLALLGALFEDDVAAVSAQGGLVSFRSVLQNPFLHLPHDAIVPGALTIGDLPDLVAALSPRPVLVAGLVDGLNRRVAAEAVTDEYGAATQDAVSLSGRVRGEPVSERELVGWLRGQLSR
jgi:dienelactone hydrolase